MGNSHSRTLSILSLLQISDSALPIGSYSHSWGLETFVQNGTITSTKEAIEAVNNLLRFTLAPREGVAVVLAYRYARTPNRVNNRNSLSVLNSYLSASLWPSETHNASISLGQRLLRLAESLEWCRQEELMAFHTINNAPLLETEVLTKGSEAKYICHHSTSVGFLGAKLDIDLNDLVPAYLMAVITSLVAALVKLVPLGHTDGQRIILQSQAAIAECTGACLNATLADLGGFAPLSEWASVEHQSLYSRLFQS